jgi:hypothetical protein
MLNNLKILFLLTLFGISICDLFYTTITSGEVYLFNFSNNTAKLVVKNQGALSKITNSKNYLYWISGKNIMKNTKGYWLDVVVFAKTDITLNKHISAMYAIKNTLYWSIGNKIYTLDIFDTAPKIFYESSNTSTTITSLSYLSDYDMLIFANITNYISLIDVSTKEVQLLDYSDSLNPNNCGNIYEIRTVGGAFFMITYGPSSGYGCIFKGSVQDIRNLNLYQKSGASEFNLLDIAINASSILSLHHNSNCLTSLFMDYPKFCIPDSLGYFGGASFDVTINI